jgi:hypothetical protein
MLLTTREDLVRGLERHPILQKTFHCDRCGVDYTRHALSITRSG